MGDWVYNGRSVLVIPEIIIHIKQQIMKEMGSDIIFIFEIIFVIVIYHYMYIACNKELLMKNYYLSYKCCY